MVLLNNSVVLLYKTNLTVLFAYPGNFLFNILRAVRVRSQISDGGVTNDSQW